MAFCFELIMLFFKSVQLCTQLLLFHCLKPALTLCQRLVLLPNTLSLSILYFAVKLLLKIPSCTATRVHPSAPLVAARNRMLLAGACAAFLFSCCCFSLAAAENLCAVNYASIGSVAAAKVVGGCPSRGCDLIVPLQPHASRRHTDGFLLE